MQLRNKKILPGRTDATPNLPTRRVLADKSTRVSGGGNNFLSCSQASEEDNDTRKMGEMESQQLLRRNEDRETELRRLKNMVLNGETTERRPRERASIPLPRPTRVEGNSPPLHAVGSHQSYPSSGKPKAKITNPTTLEPGMVNIFLNQVKSADKLGVHIAASTNLEGNAFKLMERRCNELSNSWEVLRELQRIADRDEEMGRDEPLQLVTTKLKWSTDSKNSVE